MVDQRQRLRKRILLSLIVVFAVITIVSMVAGVKSFAQQDQQQTATGIAGDAAMTPERASVSRFAFLAAAIAFGLGAIGAGVAIGHVGAAAMGAVAEKPEIAGQALIFVALAEGLVVFGFITALMIIGKV
jgi:V/A-type H+-transporting ATPase subunit K